MPRGKRSTETAKQVKVLVDMGFTAQQVADFFGLSESTIRKHHAKLFPKGRPRVRVDLKLAMTTSMIHPTEKELSIILGMSESKLRELKRENPDFLAAIEKGETEGKMALRRKRFQMALEKDHVGMMIWLSKQWFGESDKVDSTVENKNFVHVFGKPEELTKEQWLEKYGSQSEGSKPEEAAN